MNTSYSVIAKKCDYIDCICSSKVHDACHMTHSVVVTTRNYNVQLKVLVFEFPWSSYSE
jgi:hypothetical protein